MQTERDEMSDDELLIEDSPAAVRRHAAGNASGKTAVTVRPVEGNRS